MICNLTLNPIEYYLSNEIIDFKRDEVSALYKEFWSDHIPDYIMLAKDLADIAEESGANAAVFDVPSYAVSILETELMLRKILPMHYYSSQFIETKTEVLLENLYQILESHTGENLEEQGEFKEEVEETIIAEADVEKLSSEEVTIQEDPIEEPKERVEEVVAEKSFSSSIHENAPIHSLNITIKQKFKY